MKDKLAKTLRILDAIDRSMSHSVYDVWTPEESYRRNSLVLLAAQQAQEAGLPVYMNHDNDTGEGWPVVYIELPAQVSWHVPSQFFMEEWKGEPIQIHAHPKWDGHTRDEKSERIAAFIAENQ